MVDMQQARGIAESYIRSVSRNVQGEVVINDKLTIEKSYGWIFFYNLREYFETEDVMDMLFGCNPLFVTRETGELYEILPSVSIEKFIKIYELEGPIGEICYYHVT